MECAKIGWTTFGDNNLSLVKGLSTIYHEGPSTIGIDTIYLSRGNVPEVFLRGAGVSEELISYMKSLSRNTFEFYSCFISYIHADMAFARRLHGALQGRGIRSWLDEHQLFPGQDIYEEVYRGIRFWGKVLLRCSKYSLTSWWVDREIDLAFQKEQNILRDGDNHVLALIPLNLDGYMFSKIGRAERQITLGHA